MRRALAAAAIGLIACQASAQRATSSADAGGGNTAYDTAKANAYLQRNAACLVRYDTARTSALLRSVPGSDDESRIVYAMRSRVSNCMGIQLYAKIMWVDELAERGAVAEAIYHRDYPGGIAVAAQASPAAAWAAGKDATPGRLALDAVGRCVAASGPSAAAALLAAEYGSAAETRAIEALGPMLTACTDSGGGIRTTRMTLRGQMAEQLMRLAGAGQNGTVATAQETRS